jgi:aromatic ring hydroxylase
MLTGAEYKASLQDGRQVYFQGRQITDLAAEPGLATPLEAAADYRGARGTAEELGGQDRQGPAARAVPAGRGRLV